jgi:hypothetical protein
MLGLLNQETIYSLLTIFFLSYYVRGKIQPIVTQFYNNLNFFNLFSVLMTSQDMTKIFELENSDANNQQIEINNQEINKPEMKYENKFLDDIRKLNKEFIFDEKELELEKNKFNEFFLLAQDDYLNKLKEIKGIKDKMSSNELEIKKCEQNSDDEFCTIDYCENDEQDEKDEKGIKQNTIKRLLEESLELGKTLLEITDNLQDIDKLSIKSQEMAKQFVIDDRLDKLKNSFIMEKTPLGNVLMLYNNKRGSFEYYSDNTIPYRYLEPVSRKYVKMFGCRPIYFDMEEELKNYEKKLEEKEREKEEKRLLEEEEKKQKKIVIVEPKKKVFAKFKSYNKEAGTGHVNMGAPPKNSIPNNKVTDNNSNEKILLKENANRYSYEGKISNFNFLKKIDRKVVDKKYAMTFADFKRLQEEKLNK